MHTTRQLRRAWAPPCEGPFLTLTLVPGVRVTVDRRAAEAVRALGTVFQAHGYAVRPGDTGAYNCRRITGGSGYSLHAYGIAIDVNWNGNPFRRDRLVTDMPPEMIGDVLRIRTSEGLPVWRWGGDWDGDPSTSHSVYDAMHFEVALFPDELAAGIDWSTVARPERDPDRPATWPVLELGDRGPVVAQLQRRLGVAADGIFGLRTQAAVLAYQRRHGLTPDGVVGLQTWTALLTDQPPLAAGVESPVKRQGSLRSQATGGGRRGDRVTGLRRDPRMPLLAAD